MERDRIEKYEKCGAIARMLMDTQVEKVAKAEHDYFFACHDAYKKFFGEGPIRAMERLPRGWLEFQSGYKFNVMGTSLWLNFSAKSEVVFFSEKATLKFPTEIEKAAKGYPNKYLFPAHIEEIINDNHHAYDEFYHALRTYQNKEQIRREISSLFAESLRAISNIRSKKGIIEAWPEMEKYLPMPPKDERLKVQLPATNFDILNDKIGLPKEEAT